MSFSDTVVLVGNYPPPWGGIARHVADLADLLERSRMPYRLIDLGRGQYPASDQDETERLFDLHQGRIEVPATRAQLVAALARAGAAGHLMHLHTNGHNFLSWLLSLLTGSFRTTLRPRHLITVHSGLAPDFVRDSGPLRRQMIRLVSRQFARVICVNELIAKELDQLGVPERRLTVLPAFSPSSVRPGRLPAELASLDPEALLIGAPLSPGPEYGAAVFFDGISRLVSDGRYPALRAVVFGPGTQSPEMRRMALRAGLGDRTHFLGPLAHGASLATLARLDVMVRPSLADGDSVSVREALALGRPTVASHVGHRPPGTILFTSGDAAALATAVECALSAPPPIAPQRHDPLPTLLRWYRELLGDSAPEEVRPCAALLDS